MRARHKSWQSDRPLKKSSRRVVWFQGKGSIRLEFLDGERRINWFYTDEANATRDYEAFIAGDLTTKMLHDKLHRTREERFPLPGK